MIALPVRSPAPPPRRILEAIEPAIEHAKVEVAEKVEAVEMAASLKPRRGRPPKTGRVAKCEASASSRTPRKVARGPEAPAAPAAPEFASAMHAAPPHETKAVFRANVRITHGQVTQGRVAHGDRVEAATNLPRGERWKRRVPKVLW